VIKILHSGDLVRYIDWKSAFFGSEVLYDLV